MSFSSSSSSFASSSSSSSCPIRVAHASLTGETHASYGEACQDRVLVPPADSITYPILCTICDGHGDDGDAVSEYVVSHLPSILPIASPSPPFILAYDTLDKSIEKHQEWRGSGSTALSVYITSNQIQIAQTGDAVAWCVRWDQDSESLITSNLHPRIHRVSDPDECKRIIDAGGTIKDDYVTLDGDHISVTRSLGDHDFGPLILSTPDVATHPITSHDLFLLLATDGVWESCENARDASDLMTKCLIQSYNHEMSNKKEIDQTWENTVLKRACDTFLDALDDRSPLLDDATIILITLRPLSDLIMTLTPTPSDVKTQVHPEGHQIMATKHHMEQDEWSQQSSNIPS